MSDLHDLETEGSDSAESPWVRVGEFEQVGTLCEKHGFAAMASHWCPCEQSTVVYERRADV